MAYSPKEIEHYLIINNQKIKIDPPSTKHQAIVKHSVEPYEVNLKRRYDSYIKKRDDGRT